MELNLCLILWCQMPPYAEPRDNHRPLRKDLPCVAAMQTYVHVIAFLHRDEHWNPDSAVPGQAEMIFFKNADNPVGTVRHGFEQLIGRLRLDHTRGGIKALDEAVQECLSPPEGSHHFAIGQQRKPAWD